MSDIIRGEHSKVDSIGNATYYNQHCNRNEERLVGISVDWRWLKKESNVEETGTDLEVLVFSKTKIEREKNER